MCRFTITCSIIIGSRSFGKTNRVVLESTFEVHLTNNNILIHND